MYNGFKTYEQGRTVPCVCNSNFNWGTIATLRIDLRISHQKQRIDIGQRTRRLTRIEAIRLRGYLIAIRSARQVSRNDGRVTKKERSRQLELLDTNSAYRSPHVEWSRLSRT